MSYDEDTTRITSLHDTIKTLRAENERLTAVMEQRQALIGQQSAENERLQAHAASMINAMKVEMERLEAERNEFKRNLIRRRGENERLKTLLYKLKWTSIDKDNMEFRCEINCYVMDEIRLALGA